MGVSCLLLLLLCIISVLCIHKFDTKANTCTMLWEECILKSSNKLDLHRPHMHSYHSSTHATTKVCAYKNCLQSNNDRPQSTQLNTEYQHGDY